jgi:uncharacterized protein (DUF1697 family)
MPFYINATNNYYQSSPESLLNTTQGQMPQQRSNVSVSKPRIQIFITTPNGKQMQFVNRDVGGNVISLNVRKTLAEQAGTFNFVISANEITDRVFSFIKESNRPDFIESRTTKITDLLVRKSYVKIKINDVVQMIGRIDTITATRNPKLENTYTVQGRDMGALLLDYKQWWALYSNSPFNTSATSALGAYANLTTFTELAPKLITAIYNRWFDIIYKKRTEKKPTLQSIEELGWYIINEKEQILTVKDILVVKDRSRYDDTSSAFAVNGALYTNEVYRNWNQLSNLGDFFSIFNQFASKPFNEIFVTSGGRKITLGKRFSQEGFTSSLLNFTLSAGEAITKALSAKFKEIGFAVSPFKYESTTLVDRISLDEDKAYLVFRPAPYYTKFNKAQDEKDFPNAYPRLLELEDLETLLVTDVIIRHKELNNYDATKIYSTFVVQRGIAGTPAMDEAAATPIWDINVLRLYGYNPLIVDVSFIAKNNLKIIAAESVFITDALQKTLAIWFRYNDLALGGVIEIAGDENAREGIAVEYARDIFGNISIPDEERLYYCNGFEQSWSVNGEFVTKLFVEHGMKKFNRKEKLENDKSTSVKNQKSLLDEFKGLVGL